MCSGLQELPEEPYDLVLGASKGAYAIAEGVDALYLPFLERLRHTVEMLQRHEEQMKADRWVELESQLIDQRRAGFPGTWSTNDELELRQLRLFFSPESGLPYSDLMFALPRRMPPWLVQWIQDNTVPDGLLLGVAEVHNLPNVFLVGRTEREGEEFQEDETIRWNPCFRTRMLNLGTKFITYRDWQHLVLEECRGGLSAGAEAGENHRTAVKDAWLVAMELGTSRLLDYELGKQPLRVPRLGLVLLNHAEGAGVRRANVVGGGELSNVLCFIHSPSARPITLLTTQISCTFVEKNAIQIMLSFQLGCDTYSFPDPPTPRRTTASIILIFYFVRGFAGWPLILPPFWCNNTRFRLLTKPTKHQNFCEVLGTYPQICLLICLVENPPDISRGALMGLCGAARGHIRSTLGELWRRLMISVWKRM